MYGLVGVFGAARYGLATEGDLLVNSWLHGRAEGIFDAVLVAYLAISIPPIQVHCVLFAAKSQGLARGIILWGWLPPQHCYCVSGRLQHIDGMHVMAALAALYAGLSGGG